MGPGQELIGPTLHACRYSAVAAGRTGFRGIRGALMLAVSEILGPADFTATTPGADLLVTAGPHDPADGQALTAAPTYPAPQHSRSARQIAAA